MRLKRALNRLAGLCTCGKNCAPDRIRCQTCVDYFSNKKKELKDNGLCQICGKPTESQKVYCLRCSLKRSCKKEGYSLTLEEKVKLLKKQNNKCAICKQQCELHVDHDHTTKKVRGLLCSNCNNGLGRFKDNTVLLQAATEYLNATS